MSVVARAILHGGVVEVEQHFDFGFGGAAPTPREAAFVSFAAASKRLK